MRGRGRVRLVEESSLVSPGDLNRFCERMLEDVFHAHFDRACRGVRGLPPNR